MLGSVGMLLTVFTCDRTSGMSVTRPLDRHVGDGQAQHHPFICEASCDFVSVARYSLTGDLFR